MHITVTFLIGTQVVMTDVVDYQITEGVLSVGQPDDHWSMWPLSTIESIDVRKE